MPGITGLTGQQMYDMVTSLNGGQPIDQSLFLNLLAQEQTLVESMREWFVLRKRDQSQTLTPADTFQTPKPLPSDFFFFQTEKPIVLVNQVNPNDFEDYISQIPYASIYTYQAETFKYAIDPVNNNLYFTGTVGNVYQIAISYIYKPPSITLTTTWVFPWQFTYYFPYKIAALNKGGVDFDDQNARMANDNYANADRILNSMIEWDTRMQSDALIGVDRGPIGVLPWQGGRVPING